ncbi:MAG: hypothetical protein AAGM67_04880, partial [Bacteroidota bacterium]
SGMRLKLGRNYLHFGLEYQLMLRNAVLESQRLVDDELIFQFGHVDSDFRLQSFSFSIGYEFPTFRHRLLSKIK